LSKKERAKQNGKKHAFPGIKIGERWVTTTSKGGVRKCGRVRSSKKLENADQ